ncbi:hypothetical protein EV356DRAFT_444058, partial [Viridothelium virens]
EFPEIRVDYFRTVPDIIPPLAYFLSHVHSDHLQGLESIRAPFIYCSYATRELLLKLEKRPHRLNFTKGILEGRVQTYGHLGNLAKPLPLNTPTTIELSPTENVRVTLFDANHCPGAVMFLFEGNGKAVLYTGDLRAESWWCQQLARHPVLLPYTKGLRTIDCIYLDTTFATKKDIFRQFPSKRDGICDLLTQIKEYPGDTVFHFDTWTFGYEDVWIALTTALNCEIHVDRYRGELYNNLGKTYPSGEAAVLGGFQYGNRFQMGRLTQGTYPRIHSCERGTPCPIFEDNRKVVRILPIISRFEDGTEVEEQGAGGGFGDLKQAHELEITDNESVGQLMSICAASIHDAEKLAKVLGMLVAKIPEKGSYNLTLTSNLPITDDMSLRDFVPILAEVAETKARNSYQASLRSSKLPTSQASTSAKNAAKLPEVITFPYSRHSSYEELCQLLALFQPKDVFPCTVDEKSWSLETSMQTLFGAHCSSDVFAHDQAMLRKFPDRHAVVLKRPHEQETSDAASATEASHHSTSESRSVVGGHQSTTLQPLIVQQRMAQAGIAFVDMHSHHNDRVANFADPHSYERVRRNYLAIINYRTSIPRAYSS